jgi:hypothetical protein
MSNFNVYQGYRSQYGAGLGNVIGGFFRSGIIPSSGKHQLFKMAFPHIQRIGNRLLNAGISAVGKKLLGPEPPPHVLFRKARFGNKSVRRPSKNPVVKRNGKRKHSAKPSVHLKKRRDALS